MTHPPHAEDVYVLMRLCQDYLETPTEIGLEWLEWSAARLLGTTQAPAAEVLWFLVGSDLGRYQITPDQLAGAAGQAVRRLAEIRQRILNAQPELERNER